MLEEIVRGRHACVGSAEDYDVLLRNCGCRMRHCGGDI